MDINRFTEKAQQALQSSQAAAVRRGNQQIEPEHLLLALLEQEPGLAVSILRKADVDVNGLRSGIERELDRLPRVSSVGSDDDRAYVSGRLNRVLTRAEEEAKRFKDDFVSVEHLLLALTEDTGAAGRLLKDTGLTRDRLMAALQEVRGNQRVTTQNPEATYEALERYGRDA
jgi:ATP-dependent Clp protease ATP-binding subunit ClpB